jgi:hypothetical protein
VASTTTSGSSPPHHSRASPTRSRPGSASARSASDAPARSSLAAIDEQHRGAAVQRCDRHGLADRTGAEHDDALAGRHAAAHDRAHGDRHRLDERRQPCIRARDRKRLRGRDREPLLERAVEVDADQPDPLASVAPSEPAGLAGAAGDHRPHGHALAGDEPRRAPRTDVLDDRRELVPLDARIQIVLGHRSEVGVEVVEVGAAEPDRLGAHDDLAGLGRTGLGDVDDLHRRPRSRDRGSHAADCTSWPSVARAGTAGREVRLALLRRVQPDDRRLHARVSG